MKCNKTQQWLNLQIDGQLEAERVPMLQAHLAVCGDCRQYRDDLLLAQRLLRADVAALPENFDWKLQLRLNQAMREAVRTSSFPWHDEAGGWRRWFARAGVFTSVGLCAVLAVALLGPSPGGVVPSAGGTGAVAVRAEQARLPVQETTAPAPFFDTTRRPLELSFERSRQPLGLGLQQRVSSGALGGAYWSGASERDLLRIRQLERDNEALRRRLSVRERQLMVLEAKLDSLTGPAVDRPQQD